MGISTTKHGTTPPSRRQARIVYEDTMGRPEPTAWLAPRDCRGDNGTKTALREE